MTTIIKTWGSEQWIVNNNKYCGKILNLNKGYRCSMHYHKNKTETFYVLEGSVLMETWEAKVMLPGDIIHILPEVKHRFTGLMNSKIIEFSTYHEDSDSYRIIDSGIVDLDKILIYLTKYSGIDLNRVLHTGE